MKKSLLVGIAACAMLLSACSSSDEIPEKTVSTENQIQLVLNTSADNLASRSARELNTVGDADSVDHVTMKLYNKVNDQWVLADGDHFESEEIEWTVKGTPNIIKLKNLNNNTTYKVIAYAYNKPCHYSITDNGSSFVATPEPDQNGDYQPLEELFAGESETFQTNSEGRIEELVNVEMKRMVSGLMAYFYNIPVNKILPGTTQLKNVRYINVYACAQSSAFKFPSKEDLNGLNTTVGKVKVIDFDLKELVPDYETQVSDAAENLAALFNIPARTGDDYFSTVPNSVIKGIFLFPFKGQTDITTLTIELTDAENNILKHWDVSYYDKKTKEKLKSIDIKRNSIYGLGQKVHNSSTSEDPEDQFDPNGPEGDDPLDMSAVELTISLVDNWENIFYMTLE